MSGTYTDLTDGVRDNSLIPFISATTDIFFVGFESRFTGLYSDLGTNGSYTSLAYTYPNASFVWVKVSLIDSYNFDCSKFIRWELPDKDWAKISFTATTPYAATPPDSIERYWIKISCSAVTTQAMLSKLRVFPFVSYTSAVKVSQFLQLKIDFSASSKPTDVIVEDLIRRAEDRIDYRTRKSWRFNVVVEDTDPTFVDFNRFGMFLRHKNFAKVYSIQMWNGSVFTTLTEGRNGDYQIDYDRGMIYLTRMFLLPAVYGMAGRYSQYNFGEYKNAVKVAYAYGRDGERDPEFYIVEDLATKMAAADLLRHHDYSALVVSGSDKVSLSEKIQQLSQEIELRLDELTSVSIW